MRVTLRVLGVYRSHDAGHHAPFAFADVSFAFADGLDGTDLSAAQDDEELFPLDRLAGQTALVVGDDLLHLAGPKCLQQGVPRRPLDRGVSGGEVVVGEHPDLDIAPEPRGEVQAVGSLALDTHLESRRVLADPAVHGHSLHLRHCWRVAWGRLAVVLVARAAGRDVSARTARDSLSMLAVATGRAPMARISVGTFNCENLFARFKFNKDVDPATAVRDGWDANRAHFDILNDEEKRLTAQAIKATKADVLAL